MYVQFVDAGLIEHIGPGNKQSELPEYYRNASRALTEKQRDKLDGKFNELITSIKESQGSGLFKIPNYKGNKGPKVFLLETLEAADRQSVDGANSALENRTRK